jgi:hypothetical protein
MLLKEQKCLRCKAYKSCQDDFVSWIIIIIGIIATVAIRVVIVLSHINPLFGEIAWYIGIIGFIIFFAYKYKAFESRAKIINERKLIEKINNKERLDDKDLEAISLILCSTKAKTERINFFFIFVSSIIALVIAVYVDFLK